MHCSRWLAVAVVGAVASAALNGYAADVEVPRGFSTLFTGKNFAEWRLPKNDGRHWKIVDDMIDYDGLSQAKTDKHLWTRKSYRDFVLKLDWRFKTDRGLLHRVPLLEPDGSIKKDAKGKDVYIEIDDLHGGILLRGKEKNVVNASKWPVGSGQIGPRLLDQKTPTELRAASTPKEKADNPVGEWNAFEITVKGDRVSVTLNGKEVIVNAPLPEPVKDGPIGLAHNGEVDLKKRRWREAPSLLQYRNIFIRELK